MDVQSELQGKPSGQGVVQSLAHEPLSITKRNNKYFFDEDPMVIFQVEDELFKVHQYHLARESEHFREIFALHNECKKSEKPIELSGVTISQFERLLDYFYKQHVPRNNQDALDILGVSHRFQISNLLQHSKKKLDLNLCRETPILTPLQMITLGDQYGFEDWATMACKQLLNREETLLEEEAIALGFDRLANFIEAREERLEAKATGTMFEYYTYLNSMSSTPSPTSPSHPGINIGGGAGGTVGAYAPRGSRGLRGRGSRGTTGRGRGMNLRGRGGGAMPGTANTIWAEEESE